MSIASTAAWLPAGYALIPGATFAWETFGDFGFKQTPVTNGEWGDRVRGLGEDRFILMQHDSGTGATEIFTQGKDPASILGDKRECNWDGGDILVEGSLVLFKLLENPSLLFDERERGRIFSGERQPVLVSFFESMAWCLLNTAASGGRLKYDLPTDAQYEYVASNGGTQEYGTSTGGLYGPNGEKLAYFDEYREGHGTTIPVDDPRNSFAPMGVQVAGNVFRWTRVNPMVKYTMYGLRGGAWKSYSWRAEERGGSDYGHPEGDDDDAVGFSPVVMPYLPLPH